MKIHGILKFNSNPIAILFLFLTLIIGEASASTYYVATNGSDTNKGSIDSPWKTISYAGKQLNPGDLLYVRGGTYYENYIKWTYSGTVNKPITIKAYANEKPVFDGTGNKYAINIGTEKETSYVIFDGFEFKGFKYNAFWVRRAHHITIKNNYIHDVMADDHGSLILGGPGGYTTHHITIENNTFKDIGYKIGDHPIYLASGCEDIIINNNSIDNTSGAGIHAYHGPGVKNAIIYNNIFKNCHWGVLFADGAKNINIFNNTFYNNDENFSFRHGGSGEGPEKGVLNVSIMNNISYSTSGLGITVAPRNVNEIHLNYNLWYDSDGKTIHWNYGGTDAVYYSVSELRDKTNNADHSIEAKPLFVDAAGGDFHLQSSSPAIDAGTSLSQVTTDIDNNSRPIGAGYDNGAYEYGTATKDTTPPAPPEGITILQ